MDQIPPAQLAKLAGEDQGPMTKAIVVTFVSLAGLFVCLRLFTRIVFQRRLWIDDYFVALSMCFSTCMAVCQIYQVDWGNGKHIAFLDMAAGVQILKYLYFSILAYCTSCTLTKLSILLQYRRIFTFHELRTPIHIAMGVCTAYGIEAVVAGVFSCVPVHAFWDMTKKTTAKCLNENALWYANASLNIATDLLVAILPVKAIWTLQLPRMQKTALLFILTLGWFVCIVSILRLNALIVLGHHPEDMTWYSSPTAYWSAIEANLAIVCASAPTLKPLVVKVVPAFATSHGSKAKNYGSNTNNSGPHKSGGLLGVSSRSARREVDSTLDEPTSLPVSPAPRHGTSEWVSRGRRDLEHLEKQEMVA